MRPNSRHAPSLLVLSTNKIFCAPNTPSKPEFLIVQHRPLAGVPPTSFLNQPFTAISVQNAPT